MGLGTDSYADPIHPVCPCRGCKVIHKMHNNDLFFKRIKEGSNILDL